jgi:hypothetical protein
VVMKGAMFPHYFQDTFSVFLKEDELSRPSVIYHSKALIYAHLMSYESFQCDGFLGQSFCTASLLCSIYAL